MDWISGKGHQLKSISGQILGQYLVKFPVEYRISGIRYPVNRTQKLVSGRILDKKRPGYLVHHKKREIREAAKKTVASLTRSFF